MDDDPLSLAILSNSSIPGTRVMAYVPCPAYENCKQTAVIFEKVNRARPEVRIILYINVSNHRTAIFNYLKKTCHFSKIVNTQLILIHYICKPGQGSHA